MPKRVEFKPGWSRVWATDGEWCWSTYCKSRDAEEASLLMAMRLIPIRPEHELTVCIQEAGRDVASYRQREVLVEADWRQTQWTTATRIYRAGEEPECPTE